MTNEILKNNVDGMVDILDYTDDFKDLGELYDVITNLGECYYCYYSKNSEKGILLKGYLSLGFNDKYIKLEGIFKSRDKEIRLSITEILYFVYKDKEDAKLFMEAYENE